MILESTCTQLCCAQQLGYTQTGFFATLTGNEFIGVARILIWGHMPPGHASVVHTFEAAADSWLSGSAPAVTAVGCSHVVSV